MTMRKLILGAIAFMFFYSSSGQTQTTPLPYFTFGKGLGITAPDSLFSMNIRFRIQNRAAFRTESENDLSISEVEARVRRLRLRFDGFLYSPKLTYVIQLSFSRSDMDFDNTGVPNIIRDAYVQYAFNKCFSIGLGQTKLPGNRQRINSSGDLQLPDRSIVNGVFNIDRDYGLQLNVKKKFYVLRGAISSGEGRNINTSDDGLAYTGRFEFLPFGAFTNGGEYFEGDLAREEKPKVSLAYAYSYNENAARTGGQLGNFLYESRDITTRIVDFMFKHNGWALSAEYLTRITTSPITSNQDGDQSYVYVGSGQNYQASYIFKNNYELVGRYSSLTPGEEIQSMEKLKEQFTLGLNKYIKGHRVKLQSDITLEGVHPAGVSTIDQTWIFRFQIEAGI